MKRYLKFVILLSTIFCLLFIFNTCLAAAADDCLSRPDEGATLWNNMQDCRKCGTCTLDDFIRIAVNGSKILLGFVGSLALLAFIVGGVIFLTSGGNAEQVTKGKQIILGAVIGLVIVFASYAIIQFVFTALNIPGTGGGKWATSNWFNK